MSSVARVFAIPELLEHILTRLPVRDLLIDQRVNKTFHAVTKSSPHLQRKLFFAAGARQNGDWITIPEWNPLLVEAFLRKQLPDHKSDSTVEDPGDQEQKRIMPGGSTTCFSTWIRV